MQHFRNCKSENFLKIYQKYLKIKKIRNQKYFFFYNTAFTCGGSILNTNTILSAAHCTFSRDHNEFQILAGQTNRRQGNLTAVSEVREHPVRKIKIMV